MTGVLPADRIPRVTRPRSQVVRQRFAKPLSGGSNPPEASSSSTPAAPRSSANPCNVMGLPGSGGALPASGRSSPLLDRPRPLPPSAAPVAAPETSRRAGPASAPVARDLVGVPVIAVGSGNRSTTAPRSWSRVRAYRVAVSRGSEWRASVIACLRSAPVRMTSEMYPARRAWKSRVSTPSGPSTSTGRSAASRSTRSMSAAFPTHFPGQTGDLRFRPAR